MLSNLNNALRSAPRKLISLVIGYHVWFIVGAWLPTFRTLEIPLCFYTTPENVQITAPETVQVTLQGSRTDLYHLDTKSLAVHIDTRALTPGSHAITPSHEYLLLPRTMHVTSWSPSNLVINIHSNDQLDPSTSSGQAS